MTLLTKESGEEGQADRVARLGEVCRRYSVDNARLAEHPSSFGREVVYLRSQSRVASVCVPHKVGSHAWGHFARSLSGHSYVFDGTPFDEKAAKVDVKVLVVRHPLTRLLSVYRMAFQDWCDEERFLAKQWKDTVCKMDFSKEDGEVESNKEASALHLLSSAFARHRESNDRFVRALWRHFHPHESLTDPRRQLKFTFAQFVDYLTSDNGLEAPRALAEHWAPFWRECPPCHNLTRPNFIVKMETLSADLQELLTEHMQFPSARRLAASFPHTHRQSGGHSSDETLAAEYFSQLTKGQVRRLYELYKVDHDLFGYDHQPFLDVATADEVL